MLSEIDNLIGKNEYSNALETCIKNNFVNLGYILGNILKNEKSNTSDLSNIIKEIETIKNQKILRVMMYCNFMSSYELCILWNKMSKGNFRWNNIQIVWQEPADYYCIINKPPNDVKYIPEKTIIFRMEPFMENNKNMWGEFSLPDENKFLFVGYHNKYFNNNEWHLSKDYNYLSTEPIVKDESLNNCISTVLSSKYFDKGHIKRIDFSKYLEQKCELHVYGSNHFLWKEYKGQLPLYSKDNALFPYKYTFNCENNFIDGYYTEKLIDGILSECLVFYCGAPNIKELIDEKAFVWLDLSNFENDYLIIKKAIEENWWEQRIQYIREAKQKILNEAQFFPRLEKILQNSGTN
jgi:hypothetical protein